MATSPSAAGEPQSPAGGGSVPVWDPVVRLFHWTVVVGCLLDLFVLEEGERAHRLVGYVIAAALVLRIGWGFIGTRHARFADFVPTPGRLVSYAAAMVRGNEPRTLGHNPLGAVMMLTLMALLAAVSVTGYMTTLDAFWGDDWLEELHGMLANLILMLAIVHAGGALYESRRHRENLVWSMITGRKRA